MITRPIPFSPPMVRATIDGKKSQTRRIVKPQPIAGTDALRDIPGESGESAAMDQFKRGARYGRLLLAQEAQA